MVLEKVRNIKESLPLIQGNPCDELQDMLADNVGESFSLHPVMPQLVLQTARRMRKTKSMGIDDIPTDLFLLALPHMLPAVTHIYDLSLCPHIFMDFHGAYKHSDHWVDKYTTPFPQEFEPKVI